MVILASPSPSQYMFIGASAGGTEMQLRERAAVVSRPLSSNLTRTCEHQLIQTQGGWLAQLERVPQLVIPG